MLNSSLRKPLDILMNALQQNVINGVIALILAATIWFLQPAINIQAHGLFLPTTTQTLIPISPTEVQIYTRAPAQYTVIGDINTMKHFDAMDTASNDTNFKDSLRYAQQLAATAGANGLLLMSAGTTPGGVNPLDGFIIQAQAIRVNE